MGHLLLVDNDTDILELLSIGLESEGYEVRTATNGVEALQSIEAERPDVLITDLIMPNIGGEKLLRIVESVPEWRGIRTIVISGVAIEAPELRSRTPCDIYIAKGPIASTLQYLKDSLKNFDRVAQMAQTTTIGSDGIYFRHITRELLEFKDDVDRILDRISDGICKLDRELRPVWINRAFARLLGATEEEILGRKLTDRLGDESASILHHLIRQRSERRHHAADLYFPSSRVVRVTLLMGVDEDDGHALLMCQDVTDHLLLEEQYENIVESTNDLIFTADLNGIISYVSRSAHRIIGIQPEAILGVPLWEAVPVEETEQLLRRSKELIDAANTGTLKGIAVDEWHYRAADGTERWIQARVSALRDRGGRTIGLQGTVSDITAQRRLLAEKDALLHEVHHRVRDNLQLIGSLARLSSPGTLESRIAAFEEVFDELYREETFSSVRARPLLERIVATSLANLGKPAADPSSFDIGDEVMTMRQAVSVALIFNELLVDLHGRRPTFSSADLSVRYGRDNREVCVELRLGSEPTAPLTPFYGNDVVTVLIAQLSGRGRIAVADDRVCYEIRFA